MSKRTQSKRPYRSPQLKIYGNIKALTLALSIDDENRDSAPDNIDINKTF